MAEVKVTQKELFGQVIAIVEGADVDAAVKAELVAFLNKKVDQIDAKAAKAKEKAAEKKADGDALREEVFALVTDEWQTADAITDALGKEDISKAKVIARLTQLFKADMVEKEQQKVGDAKLMCYRLKSAE